MIFLRLLNIISHHGESVATLGIGRRILLHPGAAVGAQKLGVLQKKTAIKERLFFPLKKGGKLLSSYIFDLNHRCFVRSSLLRERGDARGGEELLHRRLRHNVLLPHSAWERNRD